MGTRLTMTGIALVAALGATEAQGATFVLTPPSSTNDGTGPFTWVLRTGDPGGMQGAVAYRFNGGAWSRCAGPADVRVTTADLPEGTYTVEVVDDFEPEWFTARGRQPPDGCVGEPENIGYRAHALTVDQTAPNVGEPSVSVQGQQVLVTAPATDSASGVSSATWSMGDGTTIVDRTGSATPSALHTYTASGTYSVSLAVSDAVGNVGTRTFPVSVPPPSAPVLAQTPPPVREPGGAPAVLTVAAAPEPFRLSLGPGLTATVKRRARFTVACSAVCTLRATGTMRISGRNYTLRSAGQTLRSVGTGYVVRLSMSAAQVGRVRSAIKRRQYPLVRVRVTARANSDDDISVRSLSWRLRRVS